MSVPLPPWGPTEAWWQRWSRAFSSRFSKLMRQMSVRPKELLLGALSFQPNQAYLYNWHLMCQMSSVRWHSLHLIMQSGLHALRSKQLSAHKPNAIRFQSWGDKRCFLTQVLRFGGAGRCELFVHQAVLPAWPSITPLSWRESHVQLKSDFLQPLVDTPGVQAALSEECMIMAGCHVGSIETALSGWTSLSSGVLLAPAANQSPVDRCPCQDAVAYVESWTHCWQ